jgi:ribosomal protein S18 acetylase RimI-like enzyme
LNCFLEVRRSNSSAVAFYERHGFKYSRTRPLYYSDPNEDGLVMIRRGGTQS